MDERSLVRDLSIRKAASFSVAALALGFLLHSPESRSEVEGGVKAGRVTVTMPPLPASEEIANPLRGLYRWHDQDRAPVAEASLDEYRRFSWDTLEPTQDQYDFHLIEECAARAAAKRHKFAFRICPAVGTQGCFVPKYLVDGMPGGYTAYKPDGKTVMAYVPDWNSPFYLERTSKLLAALGKRFDGDPRISWVEIGLYGDWGEWHQYGFGVSPKIVPDGTSATKHAIVDMHVQNFKKTQLLMMTDDGDALMYALSLSPKIGIRRDSLGVPLFSDGLVKHADKWNAVKDRWKTAPFVTEPIGGYTPPQDFTLAAKQVREFHISAVGNGNFNYKELDPVQLAALYETGRTSGYRYVLGSVSYPALAERGQMLSVSTAWSNAGCAPAYQPWDVTYTLREPVGGTIAWSGMSKADLCSVLPETQAALVDDSFSLPRTLALGAYDLFVTIKDHANYYRPLALADEGRLTDGSYKIGSITVK